MGLSAGTAFVDVQPKIGAGFQGAIASRLGPIGVAGGAALAAGVAVGVGGAVALKSIGDTFDDAFDTIRVGTGAIGEDLDALKDDFRATLTAVPTDAATAAAAIADLNTRTGATGETLQGLATDVLELGRITGEDTGTLIEKGTRVLGDWGIAIEDGGAALDGLFRASQATGPPVSQLADLLVRYGAPLRQFGFGMEESAALLGKFEKEGVNTELVMGSLRVALGKIAREGGDPAEALTETIDAIQNAGSVGEANAIALETFGARAGPDMAAAIREGRFELGELFSQVADGSETIRTAADDSSDYRESWTKFKNQVLVALEPLATRFLDAIGRLFDVLAPKVQPVIDTIANALGFIGTFFDGIAGGAEDATGKLGPILGTLGTAFETVRGIIASVFGAVTGAISANRDKIAGILSTLGGIFARVAELARVIFEGLAGFWERWGGTITGVFEAVFGTVVDVLSAAFDVIAGIFDVVLGILTGDWSRAWEGIKSIVGGVVDAVVGIVRGAFDLVLTIVGGILGDLGTVVTDNIGTVLDVFRRLPGQIVDFLRELPGRMVQLGADLIAGLLRGLGNIASQLTTKIRDGIGNAVDNVKSFFGIGSPSKVIAQQLGLPLAQGVAVGAEATGKLAGGALTAGIRDAADRARREVPAAFASTLAGVPLSTSATSIGNAAVDPESTAGGAVFNFEIHADTIEGGRAVARTLQEPSLINTLERLSRKITR